MDHKSIERYECPICYELMKEPIYMCTQGHSICATCKSLLKICPTCKCKWSGARNYFLEQLVRQATLPDIEVTQSTPKKINIAIKECNKIAKWGTPTTDSYINITAYKKYSDITGFFSYLVYSILHSSSNVEIWRRNKQFQWVHDKMKEKFICIGIPPLPKEPIFGKFDSQVVERRKFQLQEFLNYICRHPILSTSSLWQHFLSSSDEVVWEKRKKSAEADPFTGSNFYLNLDVPDKNIRTNEVKTKLDELLKFIVEMEEALFYLHQISNSQLDKHCTYSKIFDKIGQNFINLGAQYHQKSTLGRNINLIGKTYIEIGNIYGDQAELSWQPLVDVISLYKGVTSSLHNIINTRNKKAETEKEILRNQKISNSKKQEEKKRTDVMTYGVFAEISHYQTDCDKMFKLVMKKFLQGQVNFYKHIVRKLENTLEVL